jgi:predicted O-methyltransferase YrrM
MKHWHLIFSWLKYRLRAQSAHGVHSPFVYRFVKEVLEDQRDFYAFEEIAALRKKLYADKRSIQVEDFGAGSLHNQSNTRVIADIAKQAGRQEKYGKLLFRMVQFFNSQRIIELGSSLGLGTAYLAKANEQASVLTIEGSATIAQAQSNFEALGLHQIEQRIGNFDEVLQPILAERNFDFIFFDGNHRKEATMNYFQWALPFVQNDSVFVFDDIHWTAGMEEAWQHISQHPSVTCSIDLFYFGIVFFNKEFKEKQHFVLRY